MTTVFSGEQNVHASTEQMYLRRERGGRKGEGVERGRWGEVRRGMEGKGREERRGDDERQREEGVERIKEEALKKHFF